MALFLIEHRHTPESCPTNNLDMVRALRAHVSPENAGKMGVTIHGDWANEPDHHVVFIVEADSQSTAEGFAAPFAGVGSVNITPGFTCEEVAIDCLGER